MGLVSSTLIAIRKLPLVLLILIPAAAIAGSWMFFDRAGYLPDWASISSERAPSFVLEVDPTSLNEFLRNKILFGLRGERISPVVAKFDSDGVELVLAGATLQPGLAQIATLFEAQQISVRNGDNGVVRISYTPARMSELKREMAERSARIIEARLSDLGSFRLSNLTGYRLSVAAQPTGTIAVRVSQPSEINRLIDFAMKPAKLQFHPVNTSLQLDKVLTGSYPEYEVIYRRQNDGRTPVVVLRRSVLSGQDFEEVRPGVDQRSAEPVVNFRSNVNGARKFAQATTENVGRPLAIVLDGEILSMPTIREPITGGQGQISGGFTEQGAKELSILLRSGPLPVILKVAGRQ